jgi:farnesyl diphosphate synthase
VKEIFSQEPISIPARFEVYEKESYEKITGLIGKVDESSGMKREVFVSFLEKVYKRSK